MLLPVELIKDNIERGSIMHADVFADIDHGKFFVVLNTVDDIIGFFFINSNINPFIKRSPEMFDMQFPMKPADYGFLNHLSYLNAAKINTIDSTVLSNHIQNGRCKKVGHMSADDMEMLLKAAQSSALFTDEEKKSFLSE